MILYFFFSYVAELWQSLFHMLINFVFVISTSWYVYHDLITYGFCRQIFRTGHVMYTFKDVFLSKVQQNKNDSLSCTVTIGIIILVNNNIYNEVLLCFLKFVDLPIRYNSLSVNITYSN